MIKVFLVEDECLVRESLRDSIAWESNGFVFVGEAGDGEMALPLIRKLKPDLLITDIRMPFMDGLELVKLVTKEIPDIKTIIISGYDDFEYARQAIELHVDKYLLKPITRTALTEALVAIREQFEKDQEQKNYNAKYISEAQEYEQYARRRFFEEMTQGTLSVSEIYDKAAMLNLDIDAAGYNIVLFMLQPQVIASEYSDNLAVLQEELMKFFTSNESYLLFRWNIMTYAVLVKGEMTKLEALTQSCIDEIKKNCDRADDTFKWYVAVGNGVERLSHLPQCFSEANHFLSYRHLLPGSHIFTERTSVKLESSEDMKSIDSIDVDKIDPMVTRSFLQTGLRSEIEGFVTDYIANLGNALNSLMFRQYILLSVRFNAAIMAKSFGQNQDEFMASLPDVAQDMSVEGAKKYLINVLEKVIELRDAESRNQYNTMLKQAISFIDENFADENMSLNMVARAVNVSANYFSAVFSQEMDETFIEYLTAKRMDKAKQLLRQTPKRSGEIAVEVGYRDPRYFSFIFRKMVGCTPRDYRAGKTS